MLYAFGFERVGVLVSDMYIVIPEPLPGQEGAERGVRLEVRMLERGELKGSIYSAQPIEVGRPGWRAGQPEPGAPPPGLPRLGTGPAGIRSRPHGQPGAVGAGAALRPRGAAG